MENAMDDYDRERIRSRAALVKKVRGWAERLWSLPLAERREIQACPKNART